MSTGINIKVTRNDVEFMAAIEQCTRAEIIHYFESAKREDLLVWTFFLLGMAVGSSVKIEKLEGK